MSTEDDKYAIMVMIQAEEIKKYVLKINSMEIHNQYLWANLRTELPSTPERIEGRPIIYHQVTNTQFPLAVHKGQDVYIFSRTFFKCLWP